MASASRDPMTSFRVGLSTPASNPFATSSSSLDETKLARVRVSRVWIAALMALVYVLFMRLSIRLDELLKRSREASSAMALSSTSSYPIDSSPLSLSDLVLPASSSLLRASLESSSAPTC